MNIRALIAALLLVPSAAIAQGNPGPFGGLFGRTPERTGNEFTAVEFRTSVAGQYDDTLALEERGPGADVARTGFASGVNAALAFERQSDRLLLSAQGGAIYQEFYREPVVGATTYIAAAHARGRVTTRLDVEGEARFQRSPFFQLAPTFTAPRPGVSVPGDPAYARLLINDSSDVAAGFTSRYSRQSTLSGRVSRRHTRDRSVAGNTYEVLGAEARWQRRLTRNVTFKAGYGRDRITQSAFPDSETIQELIDIGVDAGKQLSLSRRTSLGFTVGTSAVKRPVTGRRYRVNGGVTFSKYFGRTGNLSAGLARTTEFLPGFLEPLLSDSAHVTIGGLLSPRWEWVNSISAGTGRFGFDSPDDYLTGQATSRMSFALTPRFGLYAQYAAYYYQLPPTPTSVVLLREMSRQAVTIGITTWIPIINRVRAPRDPE